jgi:hypothetical protein
MMNKEQNVQVPQADSDKSESETTKASSSTNVDVIKLPPLLLNDKGRSMNSPVI